EILRATLGDDHPDVAMHTLGLAWACAGAGRTAEAFELLARSARLQDKVIGRVFSVTSEGQRLKYLESFQGELESFVSLVARHLADSREARAEAFGLVLRRKA